MLLKQLLELYRKHREAALYIFFGGLTTVVNYVIYIGCYYLLPGASTTVPNVIAWVVAVVFAYVTNRIWVFHSESRGATEIGGELLAFAGARVFTLLMETAMLWAAVDKMRLNNFAVKLIAGVLVIVLNYVFSKLWVFKKKTNGESQNNM